MDRIMDIGVHSTGLENTTVGVETRYRVQHEWGVCGCIIAKIDRIYYI